MKSNKRTITLLLAMGLYLIPPSAMAADPGAPAPVIVSAFAVVRQSPPVHKFLDASNALMFGTSAAMMAADIATTNRALQVPGSHEANPLSQSAASRYALKFAAFGAGMGISYMLHKAGHHKAERIVPLILGVPSAAAAVHNAGIHQ
jgi:hypothetical protein